MSKFFKPSDFACKCDRGENCTAVGMDMGTVLKLDGLRRELNESIIITSGVRCEYWNAKKNGAENSQHLVGKAIDINTSHKGGNYAARLLMLAVKHGFIGIGVSKGFIHLDTRGGDLTLFGY